MTKYAETTDLSKTAIARFPISLREVFDLFPPNTSPVREPTAETLESVPVVLVEETPPPEGLEFGASLQRGIVNDAGVWREDWTVVPMDLAEAKQRLIDMTGGTATDKMGPREPTMVDILTFMELRDYEAGHTVNVPILTAVRSKRGGSAAATATYVRGKLDLVANRAAQLQPTRFDVIDRIQAATTVAECKAIHDELVALA